VVLVAALRLFFTEQWTALARAAGHCSGKPAEGHIWLRLSGDLEVPWEADKRCALGPTTLQFSCPGVGEVTIPAVVTTSTIT
jgi:hypothetical protein